MNDDFQCNIYIPTKLIAIAKRLLTVDSLLLSSTINVINWRVDPICCLIVALLPSLPSLPFSCLDTLPTSSFR